MVVELKNIKKSFGRLEVLKNISFSLKKRERLVLLGPSGCGKTTLLRIIAGLETFEGILIKNFKKIGYVFQEPRVIPWKTVYENLKFVEDDDKKIENVLKSMKIHEFKDYFPNKLSGGMKQRINLSRALVTEPDLLLLDEPFSSLDIHIKWNLLNDLIKEWNNRDLSLIMVTHDIKEALMLGERILILSNRPAKIIKEYFNVKALSEKSLIKEIVELWNERR
ncbi:ABC transporter ATP-binding protein [Thermosipho atlanticus]|uniref:NitT/TauT family transport system ATP-binding protein n=1 Tax=Thermosipho atlanticus DSM 15807 TaxID=1123380 RepID=A0A1M5TKG8_9BACT|nr:ABC transporter ATP-binding protein [Thermosipho atlanticus]SHH51160.1 NitT/TauT family transport system ATP-binding protein [Thermosipho atlanticus DSM 15807]